jgi:universal stress protein A
MTRIEKILVPTDFSDCGRPAVEYGCQFAARLQAELHLLHVVPESDMGNDPGRAYTMSIATMDNIQDAATRHIQELGGDFGETVKVFREVRQGIPYVEILGYINDHNPDMVIMGTHSRTGLKRMLLGSVTQRVVHMSPSPVLSVHLSGHQFVAT